MKWIRRLLIAILVVVVAVLIASALGYRKMHSLPEWYARRSVDPTAQAAAANRANQKLVQTEANAALLQGALAHPEAAAINAGRGVPLVPNYIDVILTDEEANACFDSWDQAYHWSDQYSRFLTDPQIILHDHHIILAATSVELNTLISAEFAPELKDGSLRLPLVRILAGNLPLPHAFWDRYRTKLVTAVRRKTPANSRAVRIKADGSATQEMVDLVLGRLLIQILSDRPADPAVFLPYLQMGKRYLPVKLTDVTIDDDSMRLTFAPLSKAERETLVSSLKDPIDPPAEIHPNP